MRNKKIVRSFLALLAVVMCFCSVSVTAYAQGDDTPTDDSNVKVEAPDPQPLTPEGNMTLVDDIDGDAAGDKQFIVVQSKGGNYFYIIIDKANEDNNTVHFLNQVDEADLLSLIDEEVKTPEVCNCADKCAAGEVNMNCPDNAGNGKHDALGEIVNHVVDTAVPCLRRCANLTGDLADLFIYAVEHSRQIADDASDQ